MLGGSSGWILAHTSMELVRAFLSGSSTFTSLLQTFPGSMPSGKP